MISGTFHPLAQEWRYYSREKALIHTLHVAQLVNGRSGDTVLIAATPPTGGNKVPPITIPPIPGGGGGGGIFLNQPVATYHATYDGAGGVLTEYITGFELTIVPCNSTNHAGFSCALLPGEVTFVHAQLPGWYQISVGTQVQNNCGVSNIPEGANLVAFNTHVFDFLAEASLTVGNEILPPTLKIGGGGSESRETQGVTPVKVDTGAANATYLVYLDSGWAMEIGIDGFGGGCSYHSLSLFIGAIRVST